MLFKGRAKHLKVGTKGESAAVKEMQRLGLEILHRNFLIHKVGEIDIIARDGGCLVFVEVKTRSKKSLQRAGEAVNEDKKKKIWSAAKIYLKRIENESIRYRFDVVEVYLDHWFPEVRYLVNAYDKDSF